MCNDRAISMVELEFNIRICNEKKLASLDRQRLLSQKKRIKTFIQFDNKYFRMEEVGYEILYR